MKTFAKAFPWIILVLGAVFLLGRAVPASSDGAMNIHEFGKIPIVDGGRVKPYDTLARNSLLIISHRSTWEDASGERQPAIKWLLDVLADPAAAADHRVFRIDNKQVMDMLGLDNERPGFRYALSEFNSEESLREILDEARRANSKEAGERSAFDREVLDLWRKMQLHQHLAISHQTPDLRSITSQEQLVSLLQRYQRAAESPIPLAVPPRSEDDEWTPLMQASLMRDVRVAQAAMNGEAPPAADAALESLKSIFAAYREGDAATFNQEVAAYRARLASTMPENVDKAGAESWFRHFAPLYSSAVLYVLVFLLCCFAWLGWTGPLSKAAFWLALLTLVVHTAALIMRMWLDGRPPVTNLYSSAVFVGWGCVGLGLLLEWIYRNGIGTLVAAVTGFLTLVVAINLAADGGDRLGVMQAVLDTNFWLATHVTTVTLGYTATFVAGFLGILLILLGVFTKALDKEMLKTLGGMIYGVLCFALLLSFVGTVLGGIWADQSWGRFWGWDPKENGALMIVLWNALILHARWGGMVQQRGIAVMAVFGNIVTTWSWFGVNELGAGLHSYGFTEGTVFWLMLFVLSQLAIMAIGSLPVGMWRSSMMKPKRRKPRPVPGHGDIPGEPGVSPAS